MGPMEIGAVLSSLKSAGDLAKALADVRDATAFQTKAFELTREILAAHQSAIAANAAQQALLDEVRHLKERIVQLETWTAEKQRYGLTDHGCGTFTRSLKPGMEAGEPFHRICAQCYEAGRKGMLHSHGRFSSGCEQVECLACGKVMMLGCDRGDRQTTAYSDYDPFTGR